MWYRREESNVDGKKEEQMQIWWINDEREWRNGVLYHRVSFLCRNFYSFLKHVLKCVLSTGLFRIADVWKYLVLNLFFNDNIYFYAVAKSKAIVSFKSL
jgi:hypothetical protein